MEDKKIEMFIYKHFNNIEKETRLSNFINSELVREKELFNKFNFNMNYIVSRYINDLFIHLDNVRENIKEGKKEIKKIDKQIYRKIAKTFL